MYRGQNRPQVIKQTKKRFVTCGPVCPVIFAEKAGRYVIVTKKSNKI